MTVLNAPLEFWLVEEFERGEGIWDLGKVGGREYADPRAQDGPQDFQVFQNGLVAIRTVEFLYHGLKGFVMICKLLSQSPSAVQ